MDKDEGANQSVLRILCLKTTCPHDTIFVSQVGFGMVSIGSYSQVLSRYDGDRKSTVAGNAAKCGHLPLCLPCISPGTTEFSILDFDSTYLRYNVGSVLGHAISTMNICSFQ